MDKRTARRLKQTVHKSERERGREEIAARSYRPPQDGLVLFVLQADLKDAPINGRRRQWAKPQDPDDVTWETDSRDVKIYPWKIPSDKQIDAGREVWCRPYQGRWTAIVPEECLDDRPEE